VGRGAGEEVSFAGGTSWVGCAGIHILRDDDLPFSKSGWIGLNQDRVLRISGSITFSLSDGADSATHQPSGMSDLQSEESVLRWRMSLRVQDETGLVADRRRAVDIENQIS
jgi:hypothetical protein